MSPQFTNAFACLQALKQDVVGLLSILRQEQSMSHILGYVAKHHCTQHPDLIAFWLTAL